MAEPAGAALVATAVLAVGIGLSLGLLGGGGSILAVPLLVYVADLPAKEAIATSLLVVGTTSAAGVVPHARAGRVRWRTGLVFGGAGMVGAYIGGRLAVHIPEPVLLAGFGLMMVATATAMILSSPMRRGAARHGAGSELPIGRAVADGLVVGLATGLVGAGGGFLVVPALVLLGGLLMPVAVGTSMLVIAMKSFAGLAGYLSTVDVHWGLAAAVTGAATLGSLAGSRLIGRIPERLLRPAFGWFVVLVGLLVLAQQVPAGVWNDPKMWTAATMTLATAAIWRFSATAHARKR